jgi:hypothetical protein
MMFEHLEEYLMQSCKPQCDAGELTDGENTIRSSSSTLTVCLPVVLTTPVCQIARQRKVFLLAWTTTPSRYRPPPPSRIADALPQVIDHRAVKGARVYICVGRMFFFCIHAKSLETFIKVSSLSPTQHFLCVTPRYGACG